tara:strand:+ start:9976 stop:10326 length:351 start_codon:yes stop_codon:yes gene_type:complete
MDAALDDDDMIQGERTEAPLLFKVHKQKSTADTADPPTYDLTNPEHYKQWVIEPLEFIQENDLEFWRGNIIKYAMRAGFKAYPGKDATRSEIADLQKVKAYAHKRIQYLTGEDYCV